ncbi:MAG: hypothetical protein V3S89_08645 [Desulfobacterales bacterium]
MLGQHRIGVSSQATEISNPKHQLTNKRQIQKPKSQTPPDCRFEISDLDHCDLLEFWDLLFDILHGFSSETVKSRPWSNWPLSRPAVALNTEPL